MAETSGAAKVREAVAVFDDVSSLEGAVDDLRAAGFAKDQISLLAAHEAVERKLGHLMRRRHGGRRARVRGTARVAADFRLLAAAVNLARMAVLDLRGSAAGWAVAV